MGMIIDFESKKIGYYKNGQEFKWYFQEFSNDNSPVHILACNAFPSQVTITNFICGRKNIENFVKKKWSTDLDLSE